MKNLKNLRYLDDIELEKLKQQNEQIRAKSYFTNKSTVLNKAKKNSNNNSR